MAPYSKDQREVVTIFNRQPWRLSLASNKSQDTKIVPPGVRFRLEDGTLVSEVSTNEEIVIGRKPRDRDPNVTVQLDDHQGYKHGVSRYHAMIAVTNGYLVLRDLDSINGTLLNGQRCVKLNSYVLRSGDVIALGQMKLTIEFMDESPSIQ
ncbi:MAG: FHA domain-containing protein [Anaerolineae bacterium]|nr:FHA domain-containing protein [Anaerolineae bacterium]MCA9887160.1 FHA domain-containing protein [Anaerolineae bacterium]MCA9892492.1 FHA domain-containing protein [Anaerolineae bacterium]